MERLMDDTLVDITQSEWMIFEIIKIPYEQELTS